MPTLINPKEITDFTRSTAELENFLLFAVAVAGKDSDVQAQKLHEFLSYGDPGDSPFETIRKMETAGTLRYFIEVTKLGQYKRLTRLFRELATADLNLRTVTIEALESFKGIGRKTSRFFILHSRPRQRLAALDTHILRYLRNIGFVFAPLDTPQSQTEYDRWTEVLLTHWEEEEPDAVQNEDFYARKDLSNWILLSENRAPRGSRQRVPKVIHIEMSMVA